MDHLQSLSHWLQENNLDVAFISNPTSVAYFSGFYAEPEERVQALLVFPDQDPFYFGPQLEVEAVKGAGWKYGDYGYLDHEDPFAIIAEQIKNRQPNSLRWAIEKDDLPVGRYETILKYFPEATFPGDASRFIEKAKLIKTPAEIALMDEAGKQADYAFSVGFKAVQAGRTEQQIVAEIEYALMQQGVMKMSFGTIVQAGTNASDPHGEPKETKLAPNELVLFDLGTVNKGYMSDATRTIAFGKPSDKALDIHKVCLEAQLTAQAAVKPGLTAAELDQIARDVITKAGYGDYFIHRLGHGIGTSTHEFPSIMAGNNMELQPGMCFSIEPGIYIPGVAGVRIEDCVHVTETGAKPFTHTPKELQYIN
ncbi:M24 family metallopeptidase [Loigolactobacillus iwatensis]|uniref:M24 family metallopeptidase n=1 Tax=Loigolactobacillus iwatensis TaxID=1267156 RepID=UPI000F7F5AA6|nr:Xaa-Pro peptidase family protein [Loigolactobacillus iwatensis]